MNTVRAQLSQGGLQLAKKRTTVAMINVCGRTVALPGATASLADVERLLQEELGLQDQIFEIFDAAGTRLLSDFDVVEALAEERFPLCASLSDSSVHFIENRREELAQMQWKLMRDTHNQASLKISSVSRQVNNLGVQFEGLKKETDSCMDRLRNEIFSAIEALREQARADSRQLGERLTGVGQLIQAERNMREVAVEQFNKSLQGVRDSIDNNHSLMQTNGKLVMTRVEDAKRAVDHERSLREALAEKQERDLQSVSERMDEMSLSLRNAMQEYSRRFEKSCVEATDAIQGHGRTALKIRNDMETSLADSNTRIAMLEDRSATNEARLLEAQQRHNEAVDRLSQRTEKVATAMEMIRFDGSQQGGNISTLISKLAEMQDALHETKTDMWEASERERHQHEDEVRSLRDAIASEQQRMIADLDGKITQRVSLEASAREESISTVLDQVLKNSPTLPALSDKPPTKAAASAATSAGEQLVVFQCSKTQDEAPPTVAPAAAAAPVRQAVMFQPPVASAHAQRMVLGSPQMQVLPHGVTSIPSAPQLQSPGAMKAMPTSPLQIPRVLASVPRPHVKR